MTSRLAVQVVLRAGTGHEKALVLIVLLPVRVHLAREEILSLSAVHWILVRAQTRGLRLANSVGRVPLRWLPLKPL